MPSFTRTRRPALAAVAVLAGALATVQAQQPPEDKTDQSSDAFRFRSGVELINVTASVSDGSGRFVPGLSKDDFIVFEDDERQTITHFSTERVPVSLGIIVDTSGSMAGEKIRAARAALDRFINDLLGPDDEVFLMYFSDDAVLLQDWTADRRLLSRATARLAANGGTAMYDAVAQGVTLAERGQHRKKALVLISDGNDTSSQTSLRKLKQMVRETEVLVYAIGIDGDGEVTFRRAPTQPRRPVPRPSPFPFPPGRRGGWPLERFNLDQWQPPIFGGGGSRGRLDDRVNAGALRDLTDDSGGRTEIIAEASDLNPATTSIADELSRQYYLGYPSPGKKDGRWHAIRVETTNKAYRVRARRGYIAS